MTHSTHLAADHLDPLKHTEWARSLARALVRDAATADDIAQDALAIAVQSGPRPGLEMRAWLGGVVRNLVLRRSRQEARRARNERASARADRSIDHAAMLSEVEAQRRLVGHVMALDEHNRDVLLWRYFRGDTPKQIAKAEGRSVAAISNQLTRAHAALRSRLEADGGRDAWLPSVAPLLVPFAKSSPAPLFGTTSASKLGAGIASLLAVGKLQVLAIVVVTVLCGLGFRELARGPAVEPVSPTVVVQDEAAEKQGQASVGQEAAANDAEDLLAVAEPETVSRASADLRGAGTLTRLSATLVDGQAEPVTDAALVLEVADDSSVVPQTAKTDGAGKALWEDVPADQELAVYIELDEVRWPEPIATVTLEPGREHGFEWRIHPKTIVSGLLVNESGAPLPGQLVSLIAGSSDKLSFASEHEISQLRGTTLTDSSGRFLFAAVRPGSHVLIGERKSSEWSKNRLRADGTVESELKGERVESAVEFAPMETPILVPFNVPVAEMDVILYTEGRIRGRAISAASSEPVEGVAWLQVQRDDTMGWLTFVTEQDGSFTTPPLPPGSYEIEGLRGAKGWCPAGKVSANLDQSGVAVPFSAAATVRVRLAFAAGVTPTEGRLVIAPLEERLGFEHRRSHQVSSGELEVENKTIAPGTYGFFFLAKDGSCAGAHQKVELGSGSLPGGIVIHVEPAAKISFFNNSADSTARVSCLVYGMTWDTEKILAGTSATISGPPGDTLLVVTGGGRTEKSTFTLATEPGTVHRVDWD